MKKRGAILASNIVFIVLNLAFLVILILFIAKQGGGAIVMEQVYAKQIALLVDAAKPGMEITLRMDDAIEKAVENNVALDKIVKIEDNIVIVKTTQDSGYTYSFFNNVLVDVEIVRPFDKEEFNTLKINVEKK